MAPLLFLLVKGGILTALAPSSSRTSDALRAVLHALRLTWHPLQPTTLIFDPHVVDAALNGLDLLRAAVVAFTPTLVISLA